ncbi:hypothetical protein V1264_017154 [Littorina saxatilis]|uniref:Uncharacterized protein n=1 Tax=Littorina saxatilis TaxID=31220 RepID=A0AAN9BI40_9CAEN
MLGLPAAPTLTVTPGNQTLNISDALRLNCSATGDPTPRIEWLKDGRPVVSTAGGVEVSSVGVEDAGNYSCVANNTQGSATASAVVTVFYGPVFTRRPDNVTVGVGQNVSVACQVTGYPPPVLQWITPQSVVLPVSSTSGNLTVDEAGTLTISDVVSEDQGRYTCFATNNAASVTAVVIITVEGPPHFTQQPMSRIVLQGEKNTFSCHAAGYPPPAITWYRDDRMQVQQTSRLLVSPYGDLTMVSVALSDDGTYRCVVNNTRGTIQALAVLTVHAPPVLAVAPSSQSVELGQTVTLRCQVTGVPVPSQRWVRAGLTLSLDDNMSEGDDHTLTIESIRAGQLGRYSCQAHNQAGDVTATATIHLSGQPDSYFTDQPVNASVNVSEPLTLSCRARLNMTLTPVMRWYRSLRAQGANILIHTIGRNDGADSGTGVPRYWATTQGDLVFKRVTSEDEGWYYCTATYVKDPVFSDPVHINVQVPPMIEAISNPAATPENSQVTFMCTVSGDPDPEVWWRSPEGREIKVNEDGYGLVDGVLNITAATNQKDGGTWLCVACNVLGCDTADIYLGIQGKPLVRKVEAEQNMSTIRIACRPVGLPPPVVTYGQTGGSSVDSFQGHEVIDGQMYINRTLLKTVYNCTARNEHGEHHVTMSSPSDPELKGVTPSARSALLPVNVVSRLGSLPLDGVSVEYRTSASSTWTSRHISATYSQPAKADAAPGTATEDRDSVREVGAGPGGPAESGSGVSTLGGGSGAVEVRVTGLVPYTLYYMRVMLVNVLGQGPVSQTSVRFFTLPDAPPPPIDVTATSENRDLTVTWTVPQHLNGNKDNIYFEVRILNSSRVTVSQTSVPASQPAGVVFPDLDLGNHSVSVETVNSQLQLSSASVTIFVIVRQPVPDFVPVVVNVTALSDVSLTITWQIPNDPASLERPVEGYVVRLQADSLSSPLSVTVNTSIVSSHNISGLTERTHYNCSVAAYNAGGVGPYSDPITTVTLYALFSSKAYTPEIKLSMSGVGIAALGGCVGGVFLVLLIFYTVRHWRKVHHGNSLDLLRPSHGLDPLYLENPNMEMYSKNWDEVSY